MCRVIIVFWSGTSSRMTCDNSDSADSLGDVSFPSFHYFCFFADAIRHTHNPIQGLLTSSSQAGPFLADLLAPPPASQSLQIHPFNMLTRVVIPRDEINSWAFGRHIAYRVLVKVTMEQIFSVFGFHSRSGVFFAGGYKTAVSRWKLMYIPADFADRTGPLHMLLQEQVYPRIYACPLENNAATPTSYLS